MAVLITDDARKEAEIRWPQLEWSVQQPILLESTARVAFVAGAEWAAQRALEVVEQADYHNSCGSVCGSAICVWDLEQLVGT